MTVDVPDGLLLAALAVLGLLIGSFLNVVIHRVPAGLSVLTPASACPGCGHAIRSRDNVPVVSWLLLGGRCRDCGTSVALRYPLVEAGTAVLFVLAGVRFGPSAYLAAVLVLVAAGVALVAIDLDVFRLPFSITAAAGLGTILALGVDAALGGIGPLPTAILSTLVWLSVYGGIWLLTAGRGMGLGDVALAPVLGLTLGWLGWGASLVGLGAGFVLGAVVGLALIGLGHAGRRTRVPHGPFLLVGAGVGLLAGQALWTGYLGWTGLV